MNTIKIILVDDHDIVRDGIKSILQSHSSIKIVGEAGNYDELINILKFELPDIIILDISIPDKSGIEITRILKKDYPQIKIIILSMYIIDEFIFNSLEAGAIAYLPKNTSKKELISAIEHVNDGKEFISDQISNVILKGYLQKIKKGNTENKNEKLTKREKEILVLFAEGVSNKEIADKLFISIRTVESHKNHIMQKLQLNSTVDLVKYAIKNNYIDI
jgi:DNA-binding NarL/FixJ family response regulator